MTQRFICGWSLTSDELKFLTSSYKTYINRWAGNIPALVTEDEGLRKSVRQSHGITYLEGSEIQHVVEGYLQLFKLCEQAFNVCIVHDCFDGLGVTCFPTVDIVVNSGEQAHPWNYGYTLCAYGDVPLPILIVEETIVGDEVLEAASSASEVMALVQSEECVNEEVKEETCEVKPSKTLIMQDDYEAMMDIEAILQLKLRGKVDAHNGEYKKCEKNELQVKEIMERKSKRKVVRFVEPVVEKVQVCVETKCGMNHDDEIIKEVTGHFDYENDFPAL